MKRIIFSIIFLICFVPLFIASAMTVKTGDTINQKDAISGGSFFAGKKVIIDSDIDGDLFVFAEDVLINGKVSGDIIGAAQKLVIKQDIGGSLRFAAEKIELNNKIERSVTIASADVEINNNAFIGKDVAIAAENVILNGSIDGNLDVTAANLEVGGRVKKDVNYYSAEKDVEGLTIASQAVIGGNINNNAFGEIKGITPGVNVMGSVNNYPPEAPKFDFVKDGVLPLIGFLFSLAMVLFLVILIGGKNIKDIESLMLLNVGKMVGFGAILLFALPIVSIIFMVSGFGFFLGFVGFILWLLLIPFSILFSIISFGELISRKVKKDISGKIYYTTLLGMLVSFILLKIPFIGFLMILFFMWWGSGGILFKFSESRTNKSDVKKEEAVAEVVL